MIVSFAALGISILALLVALAAVGRARRLADESAATLQRAIAIAASKRSKERSP